jgi:ABC-type lipoprotein release transport system permease subunit
VRTAVACAAQRRLYRMAPGILDALGTSTRGVAWLAPCLRRRCVGETGAYPGGVMRHVGMVFRSELRRHWASWLALALLVAVIGATVLAGMSAAQRTSNAYARFSARYGFDAAIFSSSVLPPGVSNLPYVTSDVRVRYYGNGNATADGRFVPANDLGVLSLPTTHLDTSLKLLAGHLPVGPRDAIVGFSLQQQYGLHIGSVVSVPFYALSQAPEFFTSNSYVIPHGQVIAFRVVGIEASVNDFPTSTPSYSLYTSPAFDSEMAHQVLAGSFAEIRLARGINDMPQLQVYVNHHQPGGGNFSYLQNEDTAASSVAQSIQPQATGWWLFALFAALAGLALVGQALSRQSLVERDEYPTLAALGVRPRQLFELGLARAGVIGLAGALGAAALAFAVSPLAPVGEARAAEPSQGFVFSPALLGLGFLVIVALVLGLSVYPCWRASKIRVERSLSDVPVSRANSVAEMAARVGAPPSVLVGVRNALDRGRGRNSVPVATALVGSAVAVTALVATTVFGASLSNLLTTPRLYGQNWQLDLGNMTTAQVHRVVATLDADPRVTKVTWGFSGKYLKVGRVAVEGVFVTVAKGPMAFSLVDGHYPSGDSQVALGATTMSQAGLHLGSRVPISIINKSGATHSRMFQVVGVVTLPPTFSIGGLGVGAVVPIRAAEVTVCPAGPTQSACIRKVVEHTSGWGLAAGLVPGRAGRAALATYDRLFSQNVNVLYVPTNLVNFGQAVDFPLLLGLTLALFGAATLAHLLFVSVARRRRQLALLRVLGFVRRQVLATTCWQAVTVAVAGVVVGVPLGIAAGSVVWRAFSSHLGAVPVGVTPVGLISIVVAIIIVGAVVLSLVPAVLAGRVGPAEALREA